MSQLKDKDWWLGYFEVKDMVTPRRRVQKFPSKEAAIAERTSPSTQREYGMPNRITIPFQAESESEALEIMAGQ
jgi:hypothetical protein